MENELKSYKKWQICSGFVLKIIAILTMTLDHIAVVASYFGLSNTTYNVFMTIGRLSLPLFCLLIVEGVLHTKSFKKYAIRLGIMAAIISTFLAIVGYIPSLGLEQAKSFGNIFLDLLLGALAIWGLKQDGYKKLYALIPLLFVCLSFGTNKYEAVTGAVVHWYPFFLRTQYDLMSFAFILVFYFAYIIKDLYFKTRTNSEGVSADLYAGTDYERVVINVISLLLFITVVLLFHFFSSIFTAHSYPEQIYALFAGAFILLYNGQRGYNSKVFQYGGYLYYPIHILVIALVFYLLYL